MRSEKYILRLYPRTWRQRYEEEMFAMLEQHPASTLDIIDLFFGALDAHLHPHLGATGMPFYERIKHMLSLLRRSLLVIFCASIVFILAGGGLQKMTEDAAFHQAAQSYSSVGVSFEFVLIGAAGLLLAMVTGGLPILSSIIQSALRHRHYSTLLLLAVPVVAFAVFLGTTLLLEASTSPSGFFAPEGQALLHRGIFLGVLLIGAIASVWAVCFAVVRSEIPAEILRFTLLPAILGIIAMVLITAATLVWGLSLRASVPELFNGNSGMFRSSTSLSWIRLVIAMVLTTVVAAISLKRGFSARSVLRTNVG